jgi:hypothetical protein
MRGRVLSCFSFFFFVFFFSFVFVLFEVDGGGPHQLVTARRRVSVVYMP